MVGLSSLNSVTSTVGNSVDLCQIIETCDNEKLVSYYLYNNNICC
jgi:hypothetical protein